MICSKGIFYKRSLYKRNSKSEVFIDEQLNNLLLSSNTCNDTLLERINNITFLLIKENNKNSAIDENQKLDITKQVIGRNGELSDIGSKNLY